jgi:GNAT superfamily N-acetyltransferase
MDSPFAFGSTYDAEVKRQDVEWSQRAKSAAGGPLRATFFADGDGDVLGIAGGHRDTEHDQSVDLVSMWVAPAGRRRGVGRQLVEAVVAWAADTDSDAVGLWVTRGNAPAEALYLALGFVATGEDQALPSDPAKEEIRMTRSALTPINPAS